MRSVRFARLLASTALVVLLAGAAGALAQTAETPPDKAPAVSDTAPAMGSDPALGHAMPVESTGTEEFFSRQRDRHCGSVAKYARFDRPGRGSDCRRAGGS